MNTLKYCPKCGQPSLHWNETNKWYCDQCNYSLYHNCAGAVAVVLRYKDELFLTKRNQEPGLGKLDLSGGFVDPNESAEQACVRELKEELNINIDPTKLKYITSLPNIYHYNEIDYNTLDLFYEYIIDEKFIPVLAQEEISDFVWINKNEIKIEDIAFPSQKLFFEKY